MVWLCGFNCSLATSSLPKQAPGQPAAGRVVRPGGAHRLQRVLRKGHQAEGARGGALQVRRLSLNMLCSAVLCSAVLCCAVCTILNPLLLQPSSFSLRFMLEWLRGTARSGPGWHQDPTLLSVQTRTPRRLTGVLCAALGPRGGPDGSVFRPCAEAALGALRAR